MCPPQSPSAVTWLIEWRVNRAQVVEGGRLSGLGWAWRRVPPILFLPHCQASQCLPSCQLRCPGIFLVGSPHLGKGCWDDGLWGDKGLDGLMSSATNPRDGGLAAAALHCRDSGCHLHSNRYPQPRDRSLKGIVQEPACCCQEHVLFEVLGGQATPILRMKKLRHRELNQRSTTWRLAESGLGS